MMCRMAIPPCHAIAAHTDLPHNTPTDTMGAIRMCDTCPIRKQCAAQALTAGDHLDQSVRQPASGVVAAGVICTGDAHTSQQLANIAGVRPLPIRVMGTRNPRPDHCQGCGRRMIVRPRGVPLTPDMVTHCAHGYCRTCDKHRRATGEVDPAPRHLRDILGHPA